jgi:hypothetical protein
MVCIDEVNASWPRALRERSEIAAERAVIADHDNWLCRDTSVHACRINAIRYDARPRVHNIARKLPGPTSRFERFRQQANDVGVLGERGVGDGQSAVFDVAQGHVVVAPAEEHRDTPPDVVGADAAGQRLDYALFSEMSNCPDGEGCRGELRGR